MFKAGLVSRVANLIMLNKKITIHTFHGELTEGYFGGIKVFLYLLIEKILSNFTSSFIAVSKDTKNSLIDRGIGHIKKWIVINPGVDFKKVGSYSRNKKSTPTVIWVGRFERVKDPILAIQTFHELKMLSSHSYNVLMIGNGSLWGKASQLNFENKLNIKLTGWLNSIEKHLKSGHILFMTSVNEGFGLVALEAAKYSIPTISTDCGGIRDFIVDGKNGILTSREPKEIASKLDKLIRNSSEVRRLGNNAYKLAHKKFSISDYIRKNEKLYFRIYVSKK
jgi:glycosyltransferase involved in cell wall biosynthesis